MTITPRNHFWPKRWLRSFAGATLATAFVGGAIWAADPPLNFPPLPKEAPKTELPKIPDVPKKTDPKAEPVKPKLHTFAMSIKPWSDVIDWYKDESGLSFNSIEAPPTGTFNFSPAKDAKTGQPRQYTMSQVTDLINEALLTKNLILVRGEVSFRLWPADKKIDPVLVRRVSLEELKTLAARDLVQVVVDLKALIAADQVPNVTKMMSNIGEVVAMDGGRNALIMIDLAGNLRRIIDDLTTSETSESGTTAEQHSHKCVYVKARDAASQLRELIGAEPAAEVAQPITGRGDRDRRSFEGFDPSRFGQGFDPSRFGSGFDPRMTSSGRSGPRVAKPTRVISDDSTNTVHLTGPADKINQAKTFLTKVDVATEGGPIKIGRAEWQNYPVPAGMAELLAQALTERYRGTNIAAKALSGSQIMVYAAPADQLDIIGWINDTTKAQKEVTKTLPIAGMDLAEAVTLLKSMFPSQASGGPFIDKHPNETGVIVKGKPEQVAEVELVIKSGIGVGVEGAGGNVGGTRIINLKDGSAADLAEAIKQMLEGMGKPGVKVIRPGGSTPPPPIPPSSLIPPAKPFPKPPVPPVEKDKSGAGEPGTIKTYGLGVRDLDTSKMLVMGGGQLVDPSEVKKTPTEPGVVITAVGNKLIITGSDPQAVALAHELALKLIKNTGETYQVFRLNNANASEAARVLNEWFNPPPPPQQRNQNPFANLFPGGGGGRGGNPFAPQQPAPNPEDSKPRVRIVAEQSSNSLLVRANALDLITIKNLLETVIDVGPGDSKAVVKPFYIGPLQYAVATEVVAILKEVYRESTNQAASQGGTSGGFAAFGPFGGGGGRQQPLDSLGRPKQVSLTIAADDRTNSILGTATGDMAENIKEVVKVLEEKAKDSTKVVQLVATKGIDPTLIQEVIDAIQGRTPATRTQQPGMNPFGQQGGNPFGGGGNFGGGNNPFGGGQGRFGGGGGGFGTPGGGRFGGGGAAPGGGRGAGGGGGARPGGGRGGGRMQRAPEPPGSGDVGRGPDFFEQRDKDVPQQTLLYDPYEESLKNRAGAGPVADGVQTLDPVQLAGGKQLPPGVMLAQAKVDPPVAPKSGGGLDLIGPRGTVTANPLGEFGAVIVTANNQADLELVLKIIEQLYEHLKKEAATSGPSLKVVELKHGDAIGVSSLANQLGSRAAGPAALRTQQSPFQVGGQATTAGASGSVLLMPIPRRNAILMFGPEIRFPYYEKLIEDLDKPNTNLPTAIKLTKASAQQVATYLTNFYAIRYPDEGSTQNLVRFSYSTAANTVFVQAGPGDLEEIRGIIESLDKATPPANELRIIRLKNTVADDLATTLETALMANIMPQGLGVVQPTIQPGGAGGAGGLPFGPGGQQQQPGQQPGLGQTGGRGVLGSAATNTTKTVSLRFLVPGKQGTFESGYLEDVHITPDIRSNSLIVSAPKQTLELLEEVIKNLDIPSVARAQVNIFTLKRADATLTANLLQQLFSGAQRQQGTQGGPLGQQGPGALQQPGGTGATNPLRPLLTATGSVSDGAGLLDLRISVDDRTNSIIVAATQNDLDAIRAIIARLEDAEIQQRSTHVFKLRNASAVDVAAVLTQFLPATLTVINTGLTVTNYLQTSREIVVAAEPVTNNLLINATPAALAALIPVIEQLDAQPLQVSIEVLIAEVSLTNNEEFGVEVGLQSPILFGRSVIPTNSGVSLSNTTGSVIPPGTTVNSTTPIYSGSSFPFNNITTGQPNSYMMPYKQGVVALQGLTNYGVGRASQNGIGGFVFSGGSDTVNILIRALKTQGRVDNLTRPNITVLDNQIGSVNVGGLFPYVSGGQFTQFGTFQPQISQQQIGTTLTVTPRISPEGRILMRVEPSIIAPEDTLVPLGNGQFATSFRQQAVQTTVSVMDGETIVLGGLITKSNIRQENKVPWLGDLPYIGAAFRYRTQTQEKRELLVILTPHVIRSSADSERLLMEEARKMSWKLADVDRMSRSVQPLPSAVDVGPPSPPLPSPRDDVVYPDGGTPLPPPMLVPDPKPMPPKGVVPVMPQPVKPKVPDPLPRIPIPDPPKASAMPMGDGMVPASGIVIPGERR